MIDIEKVKSVLPKVKMVADYNKDNYIALADPGEKKWGAGIYLLNKSTGKATSFNPGTDLDGFEKAMNNPIWVNKEEK